MSETTDELDLLLPSISADWAELPGARVRMTALGEQPDHLSPMPTLGFAVVPVSEIGHGKGLILDVPVGTVAIRLNYEPES